MSKVAVATNRGGLDDQVSQVFGRCRTFTFVDTEGGEIENAEVAQNQNSDAMSGAGIQAAGFVANQGADAVIAGNFGPNVASVLKESGVDMLPASGITAREAVQKYLNNELQPVTKATASAKKGMGRGGGRGMRQQQPGQSPSGSASQQQSPQAPPKSSGQVDEKRIQELEDKMEDIEKALGKLKDELEDLEK